MKFVEVRYIGPEVSEDDRKEIDQYCLEVAEFFDKEIQKRITASWKP